MRNPNFVRFAMLIAALAIAACGPSSKELSGAKTAHYKGDKLEMFTKIKTTIEAKYVLQKTDENTLGIQTIGRWFTSEGLTVGERGGDMRDVPPQAIQIALVVTLQPDGDSYVVTVKPLMLRYLGTPKPQALTADDPSVPGWATGKVDQMALEIHDALAQYEVKSVPGSAPPPMAPAAPAPAADPAAAPPAPAPAATP